MSKSKVPKRISNKIVLVEDFEQQALVRRYLQRCGHGDGLRLGRLPAKGPGGSGEQYVRNQYPIQVQACRSSLGRRKSALLIVVVDADMQTTQRRSQQLSAALEAANMERRDNDEPIVVLIPRRHVETWIRALLGNTVDEHTDYKNPQPTSEEIHHAAETLYDWTRPNTIPGATSPPSLTDSLPEWKKIPS
ncbi:MAG: hypothetical protein ABSA59_19310 [Terriglobia bacterium]